MAHYELTVADTGIGMKEEFLSKVFEPFERADDDEIQCVQGTGLGLSICKSITELMGGTLSVESEYGKGSRFCASIYLKVQQEVIDDAMLAGLSVLVVDDDEMVCRNTCERLQTLGIRADWTTSGEKAVELAVNAHAQKEDYFAVIVDYRMPGMDGIAVTRRIREQIDDEIPIIMISAYDLSEQVDAAKQAGADGFITKPLFRSRLAYKLKQFIAGADVKTQPEPAASRRCFAGKRILLVEDNKLNQEIAVELLASLGVTVETAENGKVAVDMVARSAKGYYDLIFMDIQMPVMDGCTAARQIRALRREDAKTLPIFAMTANVFADDRQKTQDAGMNGHLSKPIDFEQLQQVLQTWLYR